MKLKYNPEMIREAAKEYLYLMTVEDAILPGGPGYDSEKTERELNRFIKWLGAKKYVGGGRGWSDIKKSFIGKRREDPKKLQLKAKKMVEESLKTDKIIL
jgi:hypothetical protein